MVEKLVNFGSVSRVVLWFQCANRNSNLEWTLTFQIWMFELGSIEASVFYVALYFIVVNKIARHLIADESEKDLKDLKINHRY